MSGAATERAQGVFEDAAAVWHMSDLGDASGHGSALAASGEVRLGVALAGAEREASLLRGGNGQVAQLQGGWLDAAQGGAGVLNLRGGEMTLHLRVRVPDGDWRTPLVSKHGGDDQLSYHLYGRRIGSGSKPHDWDDDQQNYLRYAGPDGHDCVLEFELGLSQPADLLEAKRRFHEARRENDPELPAFEPPIDAARGVMRVGVPVAMIGPGDWHDVTVRFSGTRLDLFVDGVLVDEEWPIGDLRPSPAPCLIGAAALDGAIQDGFHGLIDHVALWDRALTDQEVVLLSGGAIAVAERELEILGPRSTTLQYWAPRGHNVWVGDPMCLYHDGRFRVHYLHDRRHHQSKWRTGGHQFAQASTVDLVHWEHHPLTVPIDAEQWLSCGTCNCVVHDGVYYAFYGMHTGRMVPLEKTTHAHLTRQVEETGSFEPIPFEPEREVPIGAALATSRDGINFVKERETLVRAENMFVFLDPSTGLFHMVAPRYGPRKGSCRRLVSRDLRRWTLEDADFLPMGSVTPANNSGECPCYFEWNGWHYIIMGRTGFWMSRNALGPYWENFSAGGEVFTPRWDIYDGLIVPQVAPFAGDRRILAGFLWGQTDDGGILYAGHHVYRELLQYADGTLGMKWPAEMIPRSGEPLPLSFQDAPPAVSVMGNRVQIVAPEGFGYATLAGLPASVRITARVSPKPGSAGFGICVRGSGAYEGGCELRFDPGRMCAQWAAPHDGGPAQQIPATRDSHSPYAVHWGRDYALQHVEGLDQPFTLDVIVKYDWKSDSTIVDACIDGRRTMVTRRPGLTGDRLFLFARQGQVDFTDLVIRPLQE